MSLAYIPVECCSFLPISMILFSFCSSQCICFSLLSTPPFVFLYSNLSFFLCLSPTPSVLFQHLHVNVSNEPYILQKPSALSWCGDDVTSLSSLEISSVTLTPVSSPDSSQSASLPTHSQPTSGYIMPRPRVNVSYTKKLHRALCMWFHYKCSYFKQGIVHPQKNWPFNTMTENENTNNIKVVIYLLCSLLKP